MTTYPFVAYAVGVMAPLPVAPASGPYGGAATISTRLAALGVPMPNRTIAFTLNGVAIGSSTTNEQGVATLSSVSIAGLAIGVHANAIGATFAGDELFPATAGSGSLTVIDVPTPGLMTGEGVVRDNDSRYEFRFIVRENATGADRGAIALERKNKKREDDRFVARAIDNVIFSDDPSIRPGRKPRPQVDTVLFSGRGQWNGRSGYRFEAFAQDRGEPGRHRESLRVTIFDSANRIVVAFDQVIDGGNIRSMRLRR